MMVESLSASGKIISCGNGGSMCDAMHFAEELTGRFRDDRPPIAAMWHQRPLIISPAQPMITALRISFQGLLRGREMRVIYCWPLAQAATLPIFSGQPAVAREKGMKVVGLTGG
jgi:D-sedoheptulose 7-phosphate isomerase